MNFIKVGNRVLNLDQITDVVLESPTHPGEVRVISLNGGSDFKGEEAEALRHFFTAATEDVMQHYKRHLDRQSHERKMAEWYKRFNQFAEANNITYFNSYRSFLDRGDELLEPTQGNYQEFQAWWEEQSNKEIPF